MKLGQITYDSAVTSGKSDEYTGLIVIFRLGGFPGSSQVEEAKGTIVCFKPGKQGQIRLLYHPFTGGQESITLSREDFPIDIEPRTSMGTASQKSIRIFSPD